MDNVFKKFLVILFQMGICNAGYSFILHKGIFTNRPDIWILHILIISLNFSHLLRIPPHILRFPQGVAKIILPDGVDTILTLFNSKIRLCPDNCYRKKCRIFALFRLSRCKIHTFILYQSHGQDRRRLFGYWLQPSGCPETSRWCEVGKDKPDTL